MFVAQFIGFLIFMLIFTFLCFFPTPLTGGVTGFGVGIGVTGIEVFGFIGYVGTTGTWVFGFTTGGVTGIPGIGFVVGIGFTTGGVTGIPGIGLGVGFGYVVGGIGIPGIGIPGIGFVVGICFTTGFGLIVVGKALAPSSLGSGFSVSSFLGLHLPKTLHLKKSLTPPAGGSGEAGAGVSAFFLSLLPLRASNAALALFFICSLMLTPVGVARGVFGFNGVAGEVGVAGVLTWAPFLVFVNGGVIGEIGEIGDFGEVGEAG